MLPLIEIEQRMNRFGEKGMPFFVLFNFDATGGYFFSEEEWAGSEIEFSFPERVRATLSASSEISIQPLPNSFANYEELFNQVQSELHYGNSYLLNLTAATPIALQGSLEEIYEETVSRYKVLHRDRWVCFSPETFVQIRDGHIYSYPMKGTIDASLPNAEQALLQDPKEIAEHYTIVDLLRNDMSTVATHVEVTRFRYIDTLRTRGKKLLQTSSEIRGQLPANYTNTLGTLFCKLLPAGSVSGAPKRKTVELIQRIEPDSRGFYTGTACYFNGQTLDSCVLIRFIEKTSTGYVYKSGGGITVHSEASLEYQELLDKIYLPF